MDTQENSPWTTSEHCKRYCHCLKEQLKCLKIAWEDLEFSVDEQTQQVKDISQRAEDVWRDALNHTENQRAIIREQIDDAASRIERVKSELSDETFTDSKETVAPSTIKGRLDCVQAELRIWHARRAKRQEKYEVLKGQCENLRQQLGMRGSSVPVKSVTLYVLDGLSMELQRLQSDQAERQKRLETLLKELRKQCIALGEDEGIVAAEVHPSLGASRDAQSSEQDLSDKTFEALRQKMLELQETEAARREQGRLLLDTLKSLWEALNVPADDIDREIFGRLMEGPSSLYKSSHEQCMQEIARLEGARKDLMMGIIDSKRQHLVTLCETSHMPIPPMPEAGAQESGEVSDLLARVLKQLQVAVKEARDREGVLTAITTMNRALEEVDWLAEYEDDPNKYKGRDSTRKIQRAIAAGELRKQLPSLLTDVSIALDDYRDCCGRHFIFDDKDYQVEILPAVRMKVEEDGGRKTQGGKSKTPGPPKIQTRTSMTPRKNSRLGQRASGSGDGSTRKPTIPLTPRGEALRASQSLLRSTSSISRTSSISSRVEMEGHAMAEKVAKALQGSPSVSRSSSGIFEVDREHPSLLADLKVSGSGRSARTRYSARSNHDLGSLMDELCVMEEAAKSPILKTAPIVRTASDGGRHRRSGSL